MRFAFTLSGLYLSIVECDVRRCLVVVAGQRYDAIDDCKGCWCQMIPEAGAGDALPALDQEQRAVGGTLDQRRVHIQELVLLPVEFDTEVGAVILIDIQLPIFFDGEIAFAVDLKTPGGVVGDIIDVAQGRHGVRQSGVERSV